MCGRVLSLGARRFGPPSELIGPPGGAKTDLHQYRLFLASGALKRMALKRFSFLNSLATGASILRTG